MQNIPYASAVGSTMYDVRCTHPDVAVHSEHNKSISTESRTLLLYWKLFQTVTMQGASLDRKSTTGGTEDYTQMANLKFVDQHNMVAYLEKSDDNAEFHQIVDFL
ncbi:hypothetical protein Tco_0146694, partial [Tanacetum coccineum]